MATQHIDLSTWSSNDGALVVTIKPGVTVAFMSAADMPPEDYKRVMDAVADVAGMELTQRTLDRDPKVLPRIMGHLLTVLDCGLSPEDRQVWREERPKTGAVMAKVFPALMEFYKNTVGMEAAIAQANMPAVAPQQRPQPVVQQQAPGTEWGPVLAQPPAGYGPVLHSPQVSAQEMLSQGEANGSRTYSSGSDASYGATGSSAGSTFGPGQQTQPGMGSYSS